FPAPKGQKAHETVVVFDVKPSEVHKALESLGLKAGKPHRGEGGAGTGPQVEVFLELPGEEKAKRVPIEDTLLDIKTGKKMPRVPRTPPGALFMAAEAPSLNEDFRNLAPGGVFGTRGGRGFQAVVRPPPRPGFRGLHPGLHSWRRRRRA